MKKSIKMKIALAGAGLVAAIAIPLAAIAYPMFGWEHVYYSDASHTTVVGEETMYCTGKKNLRWGETTAYYDEELIDCHDPIEPPRYWPE
jgi:hypothetical protein